MEGKKVSPYHVPCLLATHLKQVIEEPVAAIISPLSLGSKHSPQILNIHRSSQLTAELLAPGYTIMTKFYL